MDPSRFAAFLVVDLMLVMTPGADWACAITAGVRGRKVAAAVAGLAGGHLLHATLVVVGVGALLAQSESAMVLLTYLGAAYLMWLGTRVARNPAPLAAGGTDSVSALRGLAKLTVLATVHVVACGVVYLGVALAARRLLRSRPGAARIVSRVSGIAMIAVAAAMVIEHAAAA